MRFDIVNRLKKKFDQAGSPATYQDIEMVFANMPGYVYWKDRFHAGVE